MIRIQVAWAARRAQTKCCLDVQWWPGRGWSSFGGRRFAFHASQPALYSVHGGIARQGTSHGEWTKGLEILRECSIARMLIHVCCILSFLQPVAMSDLDCTVVQLCMDMSIKKWWFARADTSDDVGRLNQLIYTNCVDIRSHRDFDRGDCCLQARV